MQGNTGRRMVWLGLALLAVAGAPCDGDRRGRAERRDRDGHALAFPEIGLGSITPVGDHDFWVTGGASVVDQIFALVDLSLVEVGSPDAILAAYDDTGTLIEVDDNDGPGQAPALAGEAVPIAGDVTYEIFDFEDNDTISPYRLYQLIADPATAATEVEPTTRARRPPRSRLRRSQTAPPGQRRCRLFAISLDAGEELAVALDRDPENDGFSVASLISILDTDGVTTLASGDPISGGAHGAGPIAAVTPGNYFVRVGRTAAQRRLVPDRVHHLGAEPGALAAALAAFARCSRRLQESAASIAGVSCTRKSCTGSSARPAAAQTGSSPSARTG